MSLFDPASLWFFSTLSSRSQEHEEVCGPQAGTGNRLDSPAPEVSTGADRSVLAHQTRLRHTITNEAENNTTTIKKKPADNNESVCAARSLAPLRPSATMTIGRAEPSITREISQLQTVDLSIGQTLDFGVSPKGPE